MHEYRHRRAGGDGIAERVFRKIRIELVKVLVGENKLVSRLKIGCVDQQSRAILAKVLKRQIMPVPGIEDSVQPSSQDIAAVPIAEQNREHIPGLKHPDNQVRCEWMREFA